MAKDRRIRCLCGKTQAEAVKLIALGDAFICDECIEKSYAMLKPKHESFLFFYERKYYFLSNFSAFAVFYRGRLWMTAEHAYQAAKFSDKAIIEEIFLARSPKDAKIIASYYPDKKFPAWQEIKLGIMEEILRAKLETHAWMVDMLLDSGDLHIVENSPVDPFWGWGADHKGLNMLGRLWMKLRQEKRLLLGSNVVQLFAGNGGK